MSSETREVLKSISEKYKKLANWEATFTQEVHSLGLGRSTFNEGKFQFALPNKFRYSIMQPESTDFISDGVKAWHLRFPLGRTKAAQGTEFSSVKDLELDRYLLFLRGLKTEEDFKVSSLKKDDAMTLILEPKQQQEISRLELHFEKTKPAPTKIIVVDALGTQTTITIVRYQRLTNTDSKFFQPTFVAGSKIEVIK